jgi:pimeloyl-ACP methyl ester carboxylesterase
LSVAVASDGARIFYEAAGDGPPLIVSNPTFSSHELWREQFEALSPRYRVICWDYRGHGRSDAPPEPQRYSFQQVVSDLGSVQQAAAGDEPAFLAGLSLGGTLSMSYALAHPQRVRALLLVSTGPGFRKPEALAQWRDMLERAAQRLESVGIEQYLEGRRASAELLGLEPDSERGRALRAAICASSVTGLAQFARHVAGPLPNLVDRLGELTLPTLVLIGELDRAFQASSQVLAAKLPRAERLELPGAGHVANLDQPEAFLREVEGFLIRCS